MSGTDAVNSGYGSTPTGANANKNLYGLAHGGEVKCYAQGGEVHDHEICMKMGGPVPGDDAPVPGDSSQNDTVPAMLSPHEIVLPRSVAQSPNAPQAAAQFVGQVKGQPPMGNGKSLGDVIKMLQANGLELRLESSNG